MLTGEMITRLFINTMDIHPSPEDTRESRHSNGIEHIFIFLADKIQISKTTWLMLSMKGGYIMEERGVIEVKVKIWHV